VDLHTFGEVPGEQQEQSPELQRRLQQGQDLIAACQVHGPPACGAPDQNAAD
jgi:hypothetical protein